MASFRQVVGQLFHRPEPQHETDPTVVAGVALVPFRPRDTETRRRWPRSAWRKLHDLIGRWEMHRATRSSARRTSETVLAGEDRLSVEFTDKDVGWRPT